MTKSESKPSIEYDEILDELLIPDTTGNDQYELPKKRRWFFRGGK